MSSSINKVLIVDDEDLIRELIVLELEDNNFLCTEASNAEQALEVLTNNQFDLILTDAQMPGMSGIELIRKINEEKLHVNEYIILMSGYTEATDEELTDLGLTAIIQKPFQVSEIVKIIDSLS